MRRALRPSSITFGFLYAGLIVLFGVTGVGGALPWWAWLLCAAVGGFFAGLVEAALTDLLQVVRRRR